MAGLAGAGAVWLLRERGGLIARAAGAEAERDQRRAEIERLEPRLDAAETKANALAEEAARLREKVSAGERREADIRQTTEGLTRQFRDVFAGLSGTALENASRQFLTLAETKFNEKTEAAKGEFEKRRNAVDALIGPIAEALQRTGQKLDGLSTASAELKTETVRLVRALSKPEVRGRYGEIQLRRVAELAGMTAYCDFAEQASARDDEGRLRRPDLIVKLPNERVIAVDAKMNTLAYLEAVNAKDDGERGECLERFARNMSDQVTALARKRYWAEFDGSPEFVVMFVPGDQFLDAALARRPDLLDRAAEQGVILASPATLIGLLRAVAVGWREQRIADQARELFELCREIHKRAVTLFTHAGRIGTSLESAARSYSEFKASYESRLLPKLRDLEESGAGSEKEVPEMPEVTVVPRLLEGARGEPAADGLGIGAAGV